MDSTTHSEIHQSLFSRYQKYAWALKFIEWGYHATFFETGDR